MKKSSAIALSGVLFCTLLTGCSKPPVLTKLTAETAHMPEGSSVNLKKPVVAAEGMYFSELSGREISESLRDQRPIAAMVDNESLAYPHSGISEADVVYEMMNSTFNGGITRLLVVVKDWENITLGSIRSARPTNALLQPEWGSIMCHDGGPSLMYSYYENYAWDHLSGVFSRVDNGKNWEFTEFILPGDVAATADAYGISTTYTDTKPDVDSHFNFYKYPDETMTDESLSTVSHIALPFYHNSTELTYNSDTKTYDYWNYGEQAFDGEDDEAMTFKNLIIQQIDYSVIDDEGHVLFQLVDSDRAGYYISNGHKVDITWTKTDDWDITRYYDASGNELVINRGNTYIAFVPTEDWDSIVLE